jgi:hypothetical protein
MDDRLRPGTMAVVNNFDNSSFGYCMTDVDCEGLGTNLGTVVKQSDNVIR